ncbi:unnamed protein product [Urochloa decumbens]|uniref:Uncharacterized protein n=1 Tax=Urochloa decumbens TaxID=240449 RepID=A0ABC9FA94_9POAL
MAKAAKSWRPVAAAAVLMVAAAVFACFAPCAAAAEMAPSPSPDSGAGGAPNGQLDKEVDVRLRLLDLRQTGLEDLTDSELVGFLKYMDQLEVSIGGKDFRFEKTVWDLSPRELGFRLGVVVAQAALQCNIITRVSGDDPSRPPPQIPFFIREKLRLNGIRIKIIPRP